MVDSICKGDDNMSKLGIAYVTHRGVSFNSTLYSCPEAITEQWFEMAMLSGGWNLVAKQNKRNKELLYCYDIANERWLLCSALNMQSEFDSNKLEKYLSSIQKMMETRKQNKNSEYY